MGERGDELDRLRGWKASAIRVLTEWDKVWEALGSPGPLGASKAGNALAEIERRAALPVYRDRTDLLRLLALAAEHLDDDCPHYDEIADALGYDPLDPPTPTTSPDSPEAPCG